ncbi:MAG: OmpA family protein [Planctomycetota bacterium]
MNRHRSLALFAASLAPISAVLGGCQGVSQTEYDAALTENAMLRQQIERAESDLEACETARADLQGQLDDTRSQLAQELAEGRTGFESIEGTSVSGRPGAISVNVEGDVLFASGSVELKSQAKQTLDQVAQVIEERYSDKLIRVEGHTDADPIRRSAWKTNERLSFERANAVEEYLSSRGLDSNAMYTAAFGPSEPKDSKALSRRVEIVILE